MTSTRNRYAVFPANVFAQTGSVARTQDSIPAGYEPRPSAADDDPPIIDVMIPFCANDSQYLAECLQSLAAQRYVHVRAHVVADNCAWPQLPHISIEMDRYETTGLGNWGPYRIQNALVRYAGLQAPWLALQDADDVAHPDRFWRQVRTLDDFNGGMISSSLQVFIEPGHEDDPDLKRNFAAYRVCSPGRIYTSSPLGCCVNSSRTMRRGFFERLNGFADLTCSADFDFDNRARLAGARVLDDFTILGRRRLHTGSLTGGPFKIGTAGREADNAVIMENLRLMLAESTMQTAIICGRLHTAANCLRRCD